MYTITDFLTEYKEDFAEVVDKTYGELNLGEDPLNQYFPTIDYLTLELVLLDILRQPTLAQVVGSADIPATKPVAAMNERSFNKLGLGKKWEFGDEDYDLMRKFELYMMQRNAGATGMLEEIKGYFFGNVAEMVASIRRKGYFLQSKLAQYGTIDYTDPLTGFKVQVTYSDTMPELLPAPLAGGDRWSQSVTANGLLNFELHAEAYYDQFFKYPDSVWLRRKNVRELRRQASTQSAYVASAVLNLDASQVGAVRVPEDALIDLIKERTKAKDVFIFDTLYYEENKANPQSPTPGHYLDDDMYMFVEQDNHRMAAVPSPENDWNPGVFLLNEVVQKAPIKSHVIAYQRQIPVIRDSRMIAARKVN